nr:MAG TPA: hypothetical protein [Caudoviricetes sp.]
MAIFYCATLKNSISQYRKQQDTTVKKIKQKNIAN